MFDQLLTNLNSYLKFSEEEISFFLTLFDHKHVKKYEKILEQGEICKQVAYINSGLIRYYHFTADKEHTLHIFREDTWVADYASFLKHTPSKVSIEALEDTELFMLSYDAIQRGYEKSKTFERFGRLMAEHLFLEVVESAAKTHTLSPTQRYMEILETQPDLLKRVPLKHLASMLRIEPESLSRIRKKITKL